MSARRDDAVFEGAAVPRGAESMRVMVATDGSRAGAAALRFGARLARLDASVSLVVVTVRPEDAAAPAEGAKPAPNRTAEQILTAASRALERERVAGAVRALERRESESVPDAIARHAERLRADLVVVGSEGRDTLGEWVVGGVALRLIYVANRPVLVVRAPRKRS